MKAWEVKKLCEICQINPSKAEARKKLSATDLVSFIPMSNLGIQSKAIPLSENKLLSEVVGSYTYFANNDVLLAKITPCFENGKIGIARDLTNGIGFGSSEYIVFRSIGIIEAEYLFYFLSQDSFRNSGARLMTGAVGHKRVAKDFIENHPILVPSLSEQKRIVSIVDEAFEAIDIAIDNTEQNLTNARELFDSYLNAIFTQKGEGWKEKKLDEIGGKVSTGPFGSLLHKSDYIFGGIPIVNPANIEENKIIPNFNKTISPDVAKRMHAYILKENDVVVGRRGEIGRCAVVGEEEAGWLCGSGSFFINPFENVNSIFLAHLIRSVPYRSKLEELASGATMLNLSNQSLSDLIIAMPSIDEQNQITDKLDDLKTETQRLESIYRQKLTALNELKQSILHKAFTGELTADKADLMTNIDREAIAV